MKVLGLETALPRCSAAIAVDGRIVSSAAASKDRAHAEEIHGLISRCLAKAGIGYSDINGVAVSAGPGSFTGLRVGYGAAKGLAFGSARGFAAVPTFDALASACVDSHAIAAGSVVVTLVEAGRNELYVAIYRTGPAAPDLLIPIIGPAVKAAGALGELGLLALPAGDVYVTGSENGIAAGVSALRGRAAAVEPAAVAGRVASIGAGMIARGAGTDAASAEPMYLLGKEIAR